MLIPLVEGKTRKQIVSARAQAMHYGCSAGIALLVDDPVLPDASRAALLMQHCEILYLDNKFDNACKVYDTAIEPLLERLSPECASLLADNRSTIAFALFNADGSDQFYHQVDVRRLLGVELRNSSAELEADRSVTAGKHYEALPIIWRLLLEAYRKQNWRALRGAHARMARECMVLNWPDEAVWHAVQALDKDLVIETTNSLIASRDIIRIDNVINRLLMFSKLAKHACLTAQFLYVLADCIPDDQVDQVMDWVSDYLDLAPTGWTSAELFKPIWNVVGLLATRMSHDLVLHIANKSVSHAAFVQKNSSRKHLIKSCVCLLETIAPEYLDQFVDPVLRLVTMHKSDLDFEDSLNIVCKLAERSGTCRDKLRAALFPQGVKITNPVLLEVASYLGWLPQDLDKMNSHAAEIARVLRNQVEIIDSTTEPSKLGGFGQMTKTVGTDKIVVHIGGGQHWIDAMTAHLDSLIDNSISQLVEAMLEMIADNRNIVTNRISLILSLIKFTPRLPTDLAERTSQIVSRIARGDFSESDIGQTYKEATNPLNPFKFSSGDPCELRGIALRALAHGSKIHPAFSAELHSGVLLNLLEIDNETLRWFAVASAQDADWLSESETTALIANGFDASPVVRKCVFQVLGSAVSVNLDQQGLRLGVRAIKRAADSTDSGERAEAARAAKIFLKHVAGDYEMKERLAETLKYLSSDISHYVRNCASGFDG